MLHSFNGLNYSSEGLIILKKCLSWLYPLKFVNQSFENIDHIFDFGVKTIPKG
jgi:hypothetical protein